MVLLHSRSLAEMLYHLAVCLLLRRAQLAPPHKNQDRFRYVLVLDRNFSLYLHFILTNQGKGGFTQLQGENISEEFLKSHVGESNQWEEFQTSLSLQTYTHTTSSPPFLTKQPQLQTSDTHFWSRRREHLESPQPAPVLLTSSGRTPLPTQSDLEQNAISFSSQCPLWSKVLYCPSHVPLKATVICRVWRLFP